MSSLYLPNVIAEAAVTELALLYEGHPRIGLVMATKGQIAEAVRRAVDHILGDDAWRQLPPSFIVGVGGVFVAADDDEYERDEDRCSEQAAPQVIGADSLPALGGAAVHQKGSAESGAPHVSAEVKP